MTKINIAKMTSPANRASLKNSSKIHFDKYIKYNTAQNHNEEIDSIKFNILFFVMIY